MLTAAVCLCLITVLGYPVTATVVKTFATPRQAGDALVAAVQTFDVPALETLFGPETKTVVLSGEKGVDRERANEFLAKAHERMTVSITDPRTQTRAVLLIGDDNWPFPIPLVKRTGRWAFDTNAGKQEMLLRHIGGNELDAIAISRGYVDAQHEYALQKRQGFDVNQYAQRIISTPGTQDGLAWRNANGVWEGPIGEKIATAIAQGYTDRMEPYHGYFFKVLKGQGSAAPLGQLDYVINGAMIGGFALVAAPADYGVSGVKTFMVSQDGVVYEKDFGKTTLENFKTMERFNPDRSWTPVSED
jgi:hypothetical protein